MRQKMLSMLGDGVLLFTVMVFITAMVVSVQVVLSWFI